MTRAQRIDEHGLWESLDELDEKLGLLRACEVDSLEPLELKERLLKLAADCLKRLRNADRDYLDTDLLDTISKRVTLINLSIAAYIQNNDMGQLERANNQVTQTAKEVSTILVPVSVEDVAALGEAATSFRRSIGQLAHHATKDLELLGNTIGTIISQNKRADIELSRLDQRVTDFVTKSQTQFITSENQRSSAFQKQSEARARRFSEVLEKVESDVHDEVQEWSGNHDDLLESFRTKLHEFDKATAERAEQYTSLISENRSKMKERIAELTTAADTQRDEFDKEAANVIGRLNDRLSEAESLVGIITNTAAGGSYQKVANQEMVAARFWAGATIVLLAGFVLFALYAFFFPGADSLDWGRFTRRIVATTAFLVAAGFCALQAARHQAHERSNRRLQLAVTALDPYLANLPEEMRHVVKERMADHIFAGPDSEENDSNSESNPFAKSQVELIAELLKALNKK